MNTWQNSRRENSALFWGGGGRVLVLDNPGSLCSRFFYFYRKITFFRNIQEIQKIYKNIQPRDQILTPSKGWNRSGRGQNRSGPGHKKCWKKTRRTPNPEPQTEHPKPWTSNGAPQTSNLVFCRSFFVFFVFFRLFSVRTRSKSVRTRSQSWKKKTQKMPETTLKKHFFQNRESSIKKRTIKYTKNRPSIDDFFLSSRHDFVYHFYILTSIAVTLHTLGI